MGNPSISVRKYYRSVPGDPKEPTSTVVLTSKDSHFVDTRILLEPYEQAKVSPTISEKSLQWAFAGKMRSSKQEKDEGGTTVSWHSVWDHWVDSKSKEPVSDEGDMTLQDDGTVLEKGQCVDAATGAAEDYEELWLDLPVDEIGKKRNKSSIVAKADQPDRKIQGLVVKVGGWCQGILRTDEQLTVERWRRQPQEGGEGELSAPAATEAADFTSNGWVRIFKIGDHLLPCKTICAATDGKMGVQVRYGSDDGIEWRVIEEYYY